jgi:hypothetical protein
MPDPLPKYADRNCDIVFRPPYLQADTFLTAWPILSDQAKLQAVLDTALNIPSGGALTFRPLFPVVLLVLANIGKVSSLDPRDSQRGWVSEQDICFWILCGAYTTVNGQEVLDHVAFYIPYIWVTNPYTMVNGREVVGYPKSFGWAQMASSLATMPDTLWADGLVLPTFAPTSEVTRERLFQLDKGPPLKETQSFKPGQGAAATRAFLEKIKEVGGGPGVDLNLILQLICDALGGHMPMVFLKQFRDCGDPTGACYQAIVEANATVQEFVGAGLLPNEWTIQLQQYANAKIIDDLGLLASPMVLPVGFYINYTFTMDLGTVVWSAQ